MITRTVFGRTLAFTLAVALSQVAAPVAQAAGHLVAPADMTARLQQDAAARQVRIQLVHGILDSQQARHQVGVMGLDGARLRAAVPHLSDAELKDLGVRAQQVKDVAAGHRGGGGDGLAIVGLVLLLAGLAVLVAAAGDDSYDDCYCY